MTPNFALGASCALESTVVLVNKIVRLHRALGEKERPTGQVIKALFHEYQEERKPRMKEAFHASYVMTRLQAYDGLANHFTMRVLVPLLGQSTFADKLAELVSGAPKFDFLPIQYSKLGTYKWKDEAQANGSSPVVAQKAQKIQTEVSVAQWLLELLALMTLIWILFNKREIELRKDVFLLLEDALCANVSGSNIVGRGVFVNYGEVQPTNVGRDA